MSPVGDNAARRRSCVVAPTAIAALLRRDHTSHLQNHCSITSELVAASQIVVPTDRAVRGVPTLISIDTMHVETKHDRSIWPAG